MPLSSTGVHEVRPGGSDNNAGYFNPAGGSPGTDYSQQDAAQITIDGSTISAVVHSTTTQLNITGAVVTTAWNRNGLNITGGTATADLYEITAVDTVNNRITLDKSAGTAAQTATGAIGGAKASPGAMLAKFVNGNIGWVRGGSDPESNPYIISSSSSNVSGGRLTMSVQGLLLGYLTTRGDVVVGGLRPVIKAGVNSIAVFTSAGNSLLQDVVLDGDKTSRTSTTGAGGGSSALYVNVHFRNCNGNGAQTTSSAYISCDSSGNNGIGISAPRQVSGCTVNDNTSHGVTPSNVVCVEDSLIHSNGGDGLNVGGTVCYVKNCLIANNTGDGIETSVPLHAQDTVLLGNGNYGIRATASPGIVTTRNVRYRSNTSGTTTGIVVEIGNGNLSGDPYTNSASDDYTPNFASAGWGELFQDGVSVLGGGEAIGARDIGHYQRAATSGAESNVIDFGRGQAVLKS